MAESARAPPEFAPAVAQFELAQSGPLAPAAVESIVAAIAREFSVLAECPVRGIVAGLSALGPVGVLVFPRERVGQFSRVCAEQGLALVRRPMTVTPAEGAPWQIAVERVVSEAYGCRVAVAGEDVYAIEDWAAAPED